MSEREEIVDAVCEALKREGYDVRRDKDILKYKDRIDEFMDEIGRGACVITVISDKYLKSEHCMYELLKIYENGNFERCVYPVVLEDAIIGKRGDRQKYTEFWSKKWEQYSAHFEEIGGIEKASDETIEDSKFFRKIAMESNDIISRLGSLYTENPQQVKENDFEVLKQAIRAGVETLSKHRQNHRKP